MWLNVFKKVSKKFFLYFILFISICFNMCLLFMFFYVSNTSNSSCFVQLHINSEYDICNALNDTVSKEIRFDDEENIKSLEELSYNIITYFIGNTVEIPCCISTTAVNNIFYKYTRLIYELDSLILNNNCNFFAKADETLTDKEFVSNMAKGFKYLIISKQNAFLENTFPNVSAFIFTELYKNIINIFSKYQELKYINFKIKKFMIKKFKQHYIYQSNIKVKLNAITNKKFIGSSANYVKFKIHNHNVEIYSATIVDCYQIKTKYFANKIIIKGCDDSCIYNECCMLPLLKIFTDLKISETHSTFNVILFSLMIEDFPLVLLKIMKWKNQLK